VPNIPVSLEASTTLTVAQLYGNEENYRKSLDMMLKWTDYVSEIKPEQHYLFGTLYYQLEDSKNALLNINEAVRAQEAAGKVPPRVMVWLAAWFVLRERGLQKRCSRLGEKLVRHYPKASYWRQLAQVYGILERDKQKLSALETAYLMGGVTGEKDLVILASYFLEAEVPYKAAKVLDKGINKDKSIEPTAKNLELLANSWRAGGGIR
jgi:tetratricopeptide (TPR) repeat protein